MNAEAQRGEGPEDGEKKGTAYRGDYREFA